MLRVLKNWLRSNRAIYHGYHHLITAWQRWRHGLKSVDPTFIMMRDCRISRDLVAGPYGYMGESCVIGPRVELGPYVMLASRVAVVGGDHRTDLPGVPMIFAGRSTVPPTVVEADAWVGHAAILRAGVRIGRGAIIGAGAVVTRDVPPYEIHAGIPARKVGERFPDPADRAAHDAMLGRPPTRGHYAEPIHEAPSPA